MPAIQWYNENRNRAFPFTAEIAEIPNDVVVDCGFVLGPDSGFDASIHSVFLQRIYRVGDVFTFEFASDAPLLAEHIITFVRNLSDAEYTFEDSDIEFIPDDGYFSTSFSGEHYDHFNLCEEPLWSGYLVTGTLDTLATTLASGQQWVRDAGEAIVEPPLLYNQSQGMVAAVNLANGDRVRATGPITCANPTWPHQTGIVFVQATCLQGEIYWKPGYNCVITQNATDNSITIAALAKAGEGSLCEAQVPVMVGEQPANEATNDLLDGSFRCNEVLRSISGVGGPMVNFLAGDGVSIQADPDNHRLVVDVNMRGMTVCYRG